MFTWTCQKCTRKNWAHLNYCGACGELQPAILQSRPQPISSVPISTAINLILLVLALGPACAHDWKRPDLNSWYGSLQATGKGTLSRGTSCCSGEDCHTTEAELRNGQWWARIGYPTRVADGNQDWELGDWVQIPDEIIVRGPDGNAVRNEAGEAVICHPVVWQSRGLDVSHTPIYCFVPGNQT